MLASAAALTAVGVGGALALVGNDDADERPIPAADLDQAERAALEVAGGGTVTATEVEDEESMYEVEVTRADGSQVDVQLDENFNVVKGMPDSESDSGDDD